MLIDLLLQSSLCLRNRRDNIILFFDSYKNGSADSVNQAPPAFDSLFVDAARIDLHGYKNLIIKAT